MPSQKLSTRALDIISLGECMVEFTRADASTWQMHFAGDALNTLIYAARQGMRAGFISCVGDDAIAKEMLASWKKEKINCRNVPVLHGARTGLYVVATDKKGERHFTYYRAGSAASQTLANNSAAEIVRAAKRARIFYFTGITMAVMGEQQKLISILKKLYGKVAIAFDPNYRATLWPSPQAYRRAIQAVLPFCSFVFPSEDDMTAMYPQLRVAQAMQRITKKGIVCILKCGAAGAKFFHDGRIDHLKSPRVKIVDTTAAGDAFNATVLAKIFSGASLHDAVVAANRVASVVVQHRGAIVPRATPLG